MDKQYQGRVFLLTRDKEEGARSSYRLWTVAQRPTFNRNGWWSDDDWAQAILCPKQWARTAAPSARLKPGGGPIRIRVRVEVEL